MPIDAAEALTQLKRQNASTYVRFRGSQMQVGTRRLTRAQASGKVAEKQRQPGLELGRQLPEVLRGPDGHQIDGAEPLTLVEGQLSQEVVQPLEVQGVLVEVVQKECVEESTMQKSERRSRTASTAYPHSKDWPLCFAKSKAWRPKKCVRFWT